MSDNFPQTEFYDSEENSQNPDRHFEMAYSPSLGYTHIQKLVASLEDGLGGFDEDEKTTAVAYANVDVFRESMQYIEEFGIYLYNRLSEDDSYIEAMIGTTSGQVQEVFEYFNDGEYESLAEEFLQQRTTEEWLYGILGYDALKDEKEIEDVEEVVGDVDINDMDEATDKSISTVKSILKDIARFYMQFNEVYNAVKHGRRVFPQSNLHSEIEIGDTTHSIEMEQPMVEFLCKTSGERSGRTPYTFLIPIQSLREEAVSLIEQVHSLYKHIYEMDQSIQKSRKTGEEVKFTTTLYGLGSSDSEEKNNRIVQFRNTDGAVWLPREKTPVEVDKYKDDLTFQNAVAVEVENNEIVITSNPGSEHSYEYPILFEGTMSHSEDKIMGAIVNQNFQFTPWRLPLWQYLELVDVSSIDTTDTVTFRKAHDKESETTLEASLNPPDLPEPEARDLLDYMERVGIAAEADILMPEFMGEEVKDIITGYREKELTRERAQDCLSDIKEATSGNLTTELRYVVLERAQQQEQEYRPVDSNKFHLAPYGVAVETDEEENRIEFSQADMNDDEYEVIESNSDALVCTQLVRQNTIEVADLIKQNGLDFISEVEFTESPVDAESTVQIFKKREHRNIWYSMDAVEFAIYEGVPDDIAESATVQ